MRYDLPPGVVSTAQAIEEAEYQLPEASNQDRAAWCFAQADKLESQEALLKRAPFYAEKIPFWREAGAAYLKRDDKPAPPPSAPPRPRVASSPSLAMSSRPRQRAVTPVAPVTTTLTMRGRTVPQAAQTVEPLAFFQSAQPIVRLPFARQRDIPHQQPVGTRTRPTERPTLQTADSVSAPQ